MTDTVTDDSADAAAKIEFVQYHLAPLPPGDYAIRVTQTLTIDGTQPQAPFSAERRFAVLGDRFTLKPADIHAVFPPDGSLGEHSNVLPHVVLTRSTMAWERQADPARDDLTWLALLVFEDDEKPTPSIVSLSDLQTPAAGVRFPSVTLETGQKPDDKVTVIDVKRDLLEAVLPPADDLTLLAHVRAGLASGSAPAEVGVIVANRLLEPQGITTAHLVSLEGRYTGGAFDFQGAGPNDPIRLVSLKSWSFACVEPKRSFTGLLLNLDRRPGTLRLAPNGADAAERYLARGCLALPHALRQGGRTVSWYHSPLAPAQMAGELTQPPRAADELLRYDPAIGLFDVSYAAAWQLGRMLALQSKDLSTSLFRWKRLNAQLLNQAEQQLTHAHLPIRTQPAVPDEVFARISDWFQGLSRLVGVPFEYLVPDERMLPTESIRFFWLDSLWMDCLLDGAFSIGRVTSADHAHDQDAFARGIAPSQPDGVVTGVLVRSEVVSGWPGLEVAAWDREEQERTLLRMDRLSPNVLICLFDGELTHASVRQRPETIHCGFRREGLTDNFYKDLRDAQGNEREALRIEPVLRQQATPRVLDVVGLAHAIQNRLQSGPLTSADFALQMVEGVESVDFERG
jgi:hypothetical protein